MPFRLGAPRQLQIELLESRLAPLIRDLTKQGGRVSPSVYETAQVLRFYPAAADCDAVVAWLLRQQMGDGGWGPPDARLMYRIVPTLAAVLALHAHAPDVSSARHAIRAGLRYVNDVPTQLLAPIPDEIPIAFELILPRLLDEAEEAGLQVARAPYAAVSELGQQRRARLASLAPDPGAPAVYSWEAWGEEPDPQWMHPVAGVGHSAAATAFWLSRRDKRRIAAEAQRWGERYLADASASVDSSVRGLAPTIWPICRFEQAFALHNLLIGGIIDRDLCCLELRVQLEDLAKAMRPAGLGLSDHFSPDGDDTAAATAVLAAAGFPVSPASLLTFQEDAHFVSFPGELHDAITVTARAAHALAHLNRDAARFRSTVVDRQRADGWWYGDKWNTSRVYSSLLALMALHDESHRSSRLRFLDALLAEQHAEGGWGKRHAMPIETAYGILALNVMASTGYRTRLTEEAVKRARAYLTGAVRSQRSSYEPLWVAKDLYSPVRIDHAAILAGLVAADFYLER